MAVAATNDLGDRRCKVIIETNSRTDRASWYDMWEAVQAMYGMCCRFGRGGRAINIGMKYSTAKFNDLYQIADIYTYPLLADLLSSFSRSGASKQLSLEMGPPY